MSVRSIVERVRQPEYTGENRCVPCTAVNLVIAGVLGVAIAVVSIPYGVAAFVASVGAISLRGYLVPGTPTLTKRYFPDWVLRRFEKLPEEQRGGGAMAAPTEQPATAGTETTGTESAGTETAGAGPTGPTGTETAEPIAEDARTVDPETVLSEAGAVAPCEAEDDLCLEPDFRAAWREEVLDLRERGVEAADALDALGVEEEDGSLAHYGDAVSLEREDGLGTGAQWESEAALLADVAAATVLERRLDGWNEIDSEARSQVLYALRLFVETCPECDGEVSLAAETVESCCRSVDVAAVRCEACEARLFEQERF